MQAQAQAQTPAAENPHHRLDELYGGLLTGAFVNLRGAGSPLVAARLMWVLGEEFGVGYEYSLLLNPHNPLAGDNDPRKREAVYHYTQWGFLFERIIRSRADWHPVYGLFAGFGVGGVTNSSINDLTAAEHDRYENEFADKHMAIFEPRLSWEGNMSPILCLSYGAAVRFVYGGRAGSAVSTRDGMGAYGFVAIKFGNFIEERAVQSRQSTP